jgi:hypothetical protein
MHHQYNNKMIIFKKHCEKEIIKKFKIKQKKNKTNKQTKTLCYKS